MSESLSLSNPQATFLGLESKFRGFIGGFGSGKTFVGALDQLIFAGRHPRLVQGYFAPTYRDIRDTYFSTFDEAAFHLGFNTRVRVADKEIDISRGRSHYGTIVCRSMDDPTSIVGFKIARAIVDEIDILSAEKATAAWRKIIARLRLVVPGVVNGIGVTTTPEGFKFTYEHFKRNPGRDYSMVQASTYENEEFLPPDYIQSLRDTYPEELISAYLMGEFVNLTSGTVYRQYDRTACRSVETIRPGEPLHIGQDFNVGVMASVICVQRESGLHAVKTLSGLLDTPDLIRSIKERYEGHHVTIYPDASGGSRKTVDASSTDIKLLRQAGFVVRVELTNPGVRDRILSVNTNFEKQRLWVNDARDAAADLAESLEKQPYSANGDPDKTAGFDHMNEAFGYAVHKLMPIRKPERAAAATARRPNDYGFQGGAAVDSWKVI